MQENMTLATELLHELKASAKRWFIAFCIMVGLELATIIGFMWYMSLPSEDISFDTSEGNATYIGDGNDIGGFNNGENAGNQKNGQE